MKYTEEQIGGIFTAIGAAIFFTVKFWPTQLLLIFDLFFIRLVAVLLLILSIQYGIMSGMVVLAAFIMVFYERNQRKIAAVKQMTGGGLDLGSSAAALKQLDGDETAPKSQLVQVPGDEQAGYDTIQFLPKASQQTNDFVGVGRQIAETIPLGEAAGEVWEAVGGVAF
jgi:hypothetical protein